MYKQQLDTLGNKTELKKRWTEDCFEVYFLKVILYVLPTRNKHYTVNCIMQTCSFA